MTILETFEAENNFTKISSKTCENDGSCNYSTDDILQDLEESSTILLVEEIDRLSMHQEKDVTKTISSTNSPVQSDTVIPSLLPRQSRTAGVDSIRVDENVYIAQHPLNMLPPLVESHDDDAVWLQSRAEEPIWAEIKLPPTSCTTTKPISSNVEKMKWSPLLYKSSKDEWNFEEMTFPNNAFSTADVTPDTRAICVTQNENNDNRDSSNCTTTPKNGHLTHLKTKKINSIPKSASPNSVIQPTYQTTTKSRSLQKKRLPSPLLGGVTDPVYSPPMSSFLTAEAAWIRRLHHSRRSRMHSQE
jgi:hypothetical protein